MAVTENTYTGDGSTVLFSFTFPYLDQSHVKVSLNGSDTTAFTFANATTVQLNSAPAVGVTVRIYRNSDEDNVEATFFPGSAIRATDLNENFLQSLYLNQETRRIAQDATAGTIADGSISSAKLGSEVVTEPKIGPAAVTESKIGTGAVTETKLGAGAVTNSKIAAGAVQATQLATDAVTNPKIATGAVNTDELASSAVTNDKIANSAVTQDKIGTNVLTPRVSEINGGPLAGFRNAIINGNFDIWQRGTSFTAQEYGADRWLNIRPGSACTMSRQAFTLGQTDVPGEPTYFCRMAVTSVAGAGNAAFLQQRIEGVRTFSGQTVTVSFWAKADASKPIAVEILQNFGTGGSPSAAITGIGATKTTLSTSWQRIAVAITVPSISSKTLGSDGNDYFGLNIWFDAGSSFNSRTNSLGQQSGTFDIAQVQVEAGPIATPFERRPIGAELALCQRYYQVFNCNYTTASGGNTAGFKQTVTFPEMRTSPTATTSGVGYTNANSISVALGRANRLLFGATSTAAAGAPVAVAGEVALDAEL